MRKRSPLTLHNHFIQPYRTLDILFSEYYKLLHTYMCMCMHTCVLYMCAYAQSSSVCNYMYMLAVSCMPQYHKCLNSRVPALIIHACNTSEVKRCCFSSSLDLLQCLMYAELNPLIFLIISHKYDI